MQSWTRRAFLSFFATVTLLVLDPFPREPVFPEDDELIIVDGWILRKSDLFRSPR